MRMGKDAMFRQQDMALADALEYLRAQLALAFSTDDIQEGVKAFFEKREPGVDRPVSVAVLRCRTSDRTPGGARGAEALGARARTRDARLVGTPGDAADRRAGTTTCATRAAACSRPAARSTTCSTAGRFPVLTASDCSICMTTLPGGRPPRARRARAVARRARRLQHARHDAAAASSAACASPRPAGAGTRASSAAHRPRARASCAACATSTRGERVLVETRGRRRRARRRRSPSALAASAVYVHLDLDVLDPDVLPAQFPVAGRAERHRAARRCSASSAASCDVIGLEITAFEAPEDPVERARRSTLIASILGRCCHDRRPRATRARLAALAESGLLDSPPRGRRSTASRGSSPRCCTSRSRCSRSSPPSGRCSRARSASASCARRRSRTRSAATSSSPARRWRSSTRASHPKVRDNPSIEDYGIVAYLGVPLTTSDGVRLGALCAIDHEPREWTGRDHGVLEDLAGAAMAEVELRRANRAVAEAAAELHFAADARHADAARQPARAARRPRAAAGDEAAGDVRAASTCTGMRGVNDVHGHMAGDELLTRARRGGWRARSSATGTCYRLGGVQLCALLGAERGRDAVAVASARWASALAARGRLPRGDGRAARARRGASPPCCASRTRRLARYGHVATARA